MPALRDNAGTMITETTEKTEAAAPAVAAEVPSSSYQNPAPAEAQTIEQVLGSVHTSNFPDLLRGGCSIQASKPSAEPPSGAGITCGWDSTAVR